MKSLKTFCHCVLLSLAFGAFLIVSASFAYADIQNLTITAFYKSRDGKNAHIVYRGKEMTFPTDRIENIESVKTGTNVRVLLYPEEIKMIPVSMATPAPKK